jgi:hypothetical protein
VGPRGRKNKCNNLGPQVEAKDNEHHQVFERNIGYEEATCRVKSSADAQARNTSTYGTSSRERNKDDHTVGRG